MIELHEISRMVADYMYGKTNNPISIIKKAAEIYVKYGDELPDILKTTFGECLAFTNRDFEKDCTIQEYCERGGELIEDLSGFLGEYFE